MPRKHKNDTAATTAAVAGLVASILALLVPVVFGALRPEYSQVRNYISELGETGAPHANWVNGAGFLLIGLSIFVFAFAARDQLPVRRGSLILLSMTGWAYVLSSVFPCDPGCPDQGSLSQMIHNLTGIISYPSAVVGLAQMARTLRQDQLWKKLAWLTGLCSLLAGLGFCLMLLPALQPWRGLVQRVAEAAIFGWIALISLALISGSYAKETGPNTRDVAAPARNPRD